MRHRTAGCGVGVRAGLLREALHYFVEAVCMRVDVYLPHGATPLAGKNVRIFDLG